MDEIQLTTFLQSNLTQLPGLGEEKLPRISNGQEWTFLSNHAHVLLCIAGHPEILLRVVAERVGITERAVQRIVADLEEGGYLSRTREGRRNHYQVHADRPLRHSLESHHDVGVLLSLIHGPSPVPQKSRQSV
jgi:hypothetical protein